MASPPSMPTTLIPMHGWLFPPSGLLRPHRAPCSSKHHPPQVCISACTSFPRVHASLALEGLCPAILSLRAPWLHHTHTEESPGSGSASHSSITTWPSALAGSSFHPWEAWRYRGWRVMEAPQCQIHTVTEKQLLRWDSDIIPQPTHWQVDIFVFQR